ncbi:MAG TPA: PqqD family protein [bacterium]|nr:PqqD family protein [bacterium]
MEKEYQVNAPKVISETIDGETIIINLESGNYFSLNASGGTLWQGLAGKASRAAIVENLCRLYNLKIKDAQSDVEEFFSRLLQENLIVGREGHGPGAGAESPSRSDSRPYEKPTLLKYEDMQDLLLLDPIHDVDEAGWPMTKQNAS